MQKKEGIDKIAIFTSKEGSISVDAKLSEDTLWLSLNQLVELFGRDKSVISRHLKKIFHENELDESSVVAKYATTAVDGKTYQVDYYNLDVIISVGYRVNSKRGIEFRRWANEVLKDYLIKGYSINSQKITADKIGELQQTIELLSNTLINQKLVDSEGEKILSVIKNYAKTWDILIKYDEDRLGIPDSKQSDAESIKELSYDSAISAIKSIKQELRAKGESVELFGNEKDNSLKGILANIYQTFDGNDLYPSLEEKASHLIYFLIKNHPFSDGNKRIGCFLFLLFLQKNRKSLLNFPSPEAITAMALLIAESDPKQKDLIIRLVINLIDRKNK